MRRTESGHLTDQTLGAAVGGVQVAYAAFRSVGITDKWLDALLALGQLPKEE